MATLKPHKAYSFLDDPKIPEFDKSAHLLIMDGDCMLCSIGARMISRFDKKQIFRITPIDRPLGASLLEHYGLDAKDPDSWLYITDGQAYSSMEAIIRFAKTCGGIGHILRVLQIFPTSVQDWLYQRIARNRYKLFGRTDMCALPDKNLQARLLK